MIADYVGTRNFKDVKLHANRYFLQLQMVNTQKRKEMHAMQVVDSRWTRADDQLFEELLAHYSNCAYYPWEIIATKFANKSAKGVRERYQKLLFDMALIESGHHVTMHLQHPLAPVDRGMAATEDEHDDAEFRIYDCSVTITVDEEDMLLTALEEASVPQTTSTDLLAIVASAVVAISSQSNKKPPSRTQMAFTKQDADSAIAKILALPTLDAPTVLDTLLVALNLKDDPNFLPPPDTKQALRPLLPHSMALERPHPHHPPHQHRHQEQHHHQQQHPPQVPSYHHQQHQASPDMRQGHASATCTTHTGYNI
ncbi:hypothetical protein DYB37_009140 [Aphanomyces astaci]|uniref:Myb-like domain-containing protein n=1 Tax=Aphanomyces astaci TaxID=112090 RepID=A0A3R6W7W9_APHAT|nr:hypothetical protein DYB35_000741 [Aphanomyces astaci]RHZ25443.1 hypothetical protein DYB37_009140 [Aphanomyces astaci]